MKVYSMLRGPGGLGLKYCTLIQRTLNLVCSQICVQQFLLTHIDNFISLDDKFWLLLNSSPL
jgi:hypothetical protein